MRKTALFSFTLFFIFTIHMPVSAGDFDGSKELLCACIRVMECGPEGNCAEVTAEEIGIPQFLKINFEQKTISAPQWGKTQTPSRIENFERIDGKLILQGAEDGSRDLRDGLGWSMAISRETGKMVISASGDQVAFVVFGACVPK